MYVFCINLSLANLSLIYMHAIKKMHILCFVLVEKNIVDLSFLVLALKGSNICGDLTGNFENILDIFMGIEMEMNTTPCSRQ